MWSRSSFIALSTLLLCAALASWPMARATTCSNKLDLVLCLDGSGSMTGNYHKVQKFARDMVDKFTISDTETRVAVLRYSTKVTAGTSPVFSGTKSDINTAINMPLPGGTTYTDKCISEGEQHFASTGRPSAAKLLVILTDGMPTDQPAAETAADSAIAAGIVIVGVGADVGPFGTDSVKKLTSNKCPANTGGCSQGLTGAPQCVTPCDDHYVDVSSFDDLQNSNILDRVVDVACVDPGCQFTWGSWSACSTDTTPMRLRSPVISFDPNLQAGEPGACPGVMSEPCSDVKCAAKADFLLLLDASGSMNNCDWASQAWFASEFVERLPFDSVTYKFESAQVGVVQFSSEPQTDLQLTDTRYTVTQLLDCGSMGGGAYCSATSPCNGWSESCAGSVCCSSYGAECDYEQSSGGTSTVIGLMEAMKQLMLSSRADARKVIIIATDGNPTGRESLPAEVSDWCQSKGLSLSDSQGRVVCLSRYAQEDPTTTTAANAPAETPCYSYSFCQPALEPLGATVVTVGINVGATDTLASHFKDVASDPSLFIPVADVNGGQLQDTIDSLIRKSCPPVDCVCKSDTPWGACTAQGTQTKVCVPDQLPDHGGAPCQSEVRQCNDCVWGWTEYGGCDLTTGTRSRQKEVISPATNGGKECVLGTQTDDCPVDCKSREGAWSDCSDQGTRSRSPIITTECYGDGSGVCGTNFPTPGSMHGGIACPPAETQPCSRDCKVSWGSWSKCDPASGGTQTQTPTIVTTKAGDGAECPGPRTRTCKIPCEFTWAVWGECDKTTGVQKRAPMVTQIALNNGTACPTEEERFCDVDCEYSWNAWVPQECNSGDVNQTRSITILTPCESSGNCPSGSMHKGTPCPPSETIPCGDKPCEYTWLPWSNCLDEPIGTQSRAPDVTRLPVAGGTACPRSENRTCKVDCAFTWTTWGDCDKETGTQLRTPLISQDSMNGGQVCPPTEIRDCPVDCVSEWKGPPSFPNHKDGWGVCGSAGYGRHNRTFTINTECFPLQKCPDGYLNGGAECPPEETRICAVDCVSHFDEWTPCDEVTGVQSRGVVITTKPVGGGAACLNNETRKCKVDCGYTWGEWTLCDNSTGLQERSAIKLVEPKDGWDGEGEKCPPKEEQPCEVHCMGRYSAWTACASPSGNYPPYTKSRAWITSQLPLNGGKPCPLSQRVSCLPDVCYTAESDAPNFGARRTNLRPLRTLPPAHPALSSSSAANTLFSACGADVGQMDEHSFIPRADSGKDPMCTGPALWYALDSTTSSSLNTVARPKVSQIYLLQTNSSELYFGMLNGNGQKGGNTAVASLMLSFSDINANNKNVKWQVQNDPISAANAGKPFQACFQGDANSGGCYEWDMTSKTGRATWLWDDSKTSGGILGPLPSYDFCAEVKRSDMKGIDIVEFVDATYDEKYSRPEAFHSEAFDYGLKVCTYNCNEGPPLIINPGDSGADGSASGSQSGSDVSGDSGSSGGYGSDDGNDSGNDDSYGDGDNINGDADSGSTSQKGDKGGQDSDASGDVGDGAEAGSQNLPVGIIAGASAGCCVLTILAAVLLRRRSKRKFSKMDDTKNLAPGWVQFIDEASGHPCYMHEESGETQWDHPGYATDVEMSAIENPMRQKPQHSRNATQLPDGWSGEYTEEGDKYYVDNNSGDTSWEAPPGSTGGSTGIIAAGANHGRSETQLPDGWSGEYTEAGEKYYVNDHSAETSWDAPPGSTGGSTGIAVGEQTNYSSRTKRRQTVGIVDGSKYYEDEEGNTTWEK